MKMPFLVSKCNNIKCKKFAFELFTYLSFYIHFPSIVQETVMSFCHIYFYSRSILSCLFVGVFKASFHKKSKQTNKLYTLSTAGNLYCHL